MSDSTSTASPIPADAGLPAGGPSDGAGSRSRDELLNAAAAGGGITPAENDDLVAYYLANGELPDDSKPTRLRVKLGDHGRAFSCVVHKITWDEWQDGLERATSNKTGQTDTYVWSAWNVARALIEPKLGPVVAGLQRDDPDKAPENAAELLQRMFRKQSGALLELNTKVLEVSKLSRDNDSVEVLGEDAAREVEAAKN